MPLLPRSKSSRKEFGLIAECLLKAANLVDAFDEGLDPVVFPQTNPYVNTEEMAVRWQWAIIVLIDHLDVRTDDVRRLAHAVSPNTQDALET